MLGPSALKVEPNQIQPKQTATHTIFHKLQLLQNTLASKWNLTRILLVPDKIRLTFCKTQAITLLVKKGFGPKPRKK
jgi:hypothetical protein